MTWNQICTLKSVILGEAFRVFPRSLQVNPGKKNLKFYHDCFLPNFYNSLFTDQIVIRAFIIYVNAAVKYLLTYSMEQIPTTETNRFLFSQEITLILCNPKVHYLIYKSCPYPQPDQCSHFLYPIRAIYTAHDIILDFTTRIISSEKYSSVRFSLFSFLYSPVTSSLIGPNILLSTLLTNGSNLRSSLNVNH